MKKKARNVAHKVYSIFSSVPVQGRKQRRHRKPPGQVPGTAVHTGVQKLEDVLMTVHDFDEQHYDVIPLKKIEKSEPYINNPSKTWILVQGLHDIEKIRTVWDYFSLHPLIQEDIVNITQRPKVEPYPESIFLVLRMLTIHGEESGENGLSTEQISIVLGKNYVLSFQESDEPVFEPVIKRLELQTSRLRQLGPDYLAYALVDAVVDHYFNVLDLIADSIENLEEMVIEDPKPEHLQKIHALRRDLIYFRKSVWSLRDGINSLLRDEAPLISDEVKVYMRDVYDHIVQVIDSIETSREMVYGLYDMYMSGLSNKMNEVMKVLTIIATIFIPLTFIAGIYGMNFDSSISPWNMPELSWYWGYPASLGAMAVIFVIMILFFRRKGWF